MYCAHFAQYCFVPLSASCCTSLSIYYIYVCMVGWFFPAGCSVLGDILNNTVGYYQQFLAAVLSHSDKLTAPVEKEFKVCTLIISSTPFSCPVHTFIYSYQEQVSIMRWNDGNYWALKASTEKNHRTLFNFTKKWKVHNMLPGPF